MLGILGGDDVVGDNQYFEALFYKSGSDGFDKGGLAGSYRPAYPMRQVDIILEFWRIN